MKNPIRLGKQVPFMAWVAAWLGAAATGDLGMSFAGRPVMTVLGPRLLNTVTLAAITALIDSIRTPLATAGGWPSSLSESKPHALSPCSSRAVST